jgi:diguanylate cyclase (GGDEF)-like protein
MVLLCVLCLGLTFWAVENSHKIQASLTYDQIFAIKKEFLRDSVMNTIRDIDRLRLFNRGRVQERIRRLTIDLTRLYEVAPGRFEELGIEVMSRQDNAETVNILLEDTSRNKIILRSGERSYSRKLSFGVYRIELGINESWVNSQTKAQTAQIIHSSTFANDGYIWVNEIVNWAGGDNYAVRRIHPNLPKTEGMFLSTKMTDIRGNTPYLTELEGVRDHGELFYTYYFKRKNSDAVAEKLSYATLYRDYNWIIAMGVYLEDVQVYIDFAQKAGKALTTKIVIIVFSLMVALFIFGLYVLGRMERWYLFRTANVYREESNIDALTGALNRRMGGLYLKESFERYRRTLDDPVIFFFDIDDFKRVNDTHGHDAGDAVLKSIVSRIRLGMRSTDRLFRWGGEEFLLFCHGVNPEGVIDLAEKLNTVVERTPIAVGKTEEKPTCGESAESCAEKICTDPERFSLQCVDRDGEKILHVTISIGITRFEKQDASPEAALKRADLALYQAKREGKNRFASA